MSLFWSFRRSVPPSPRASEQRASIQLYSTRRRQVTATPKEAPAALAKPGSATQGDSLEQRQSN